MIKPTFKTAPVRNALQKNELYFHLYLHQTYYGSSSNQSVIVDPEQQDSTFGWTSVNDWPLYDGLGPYAKVIARAQGLHIQAGMGIQQSWYNSFSIVFEDARFKGSSLQVMGPVVEHGECAIVGGTGEFPMAQGVIYKNFLEERTDGNIIELDIHAFYSPAPGTNGGNAFVGNATHATSGNATGWNVTGGNATGGNADGGNATGGNATGGNATGGNADGGNATGGNATGGNATGGNADGGNATGGSATGGNATGGNGTGGNGPRKAIPPPSKPKAIPRPSKPKVGPPPSNRRGGNQQQSKPTYQIMPLYEAIRTGKVKLVPW